MIRITYNLVQAFFKHNFQTFYKIRKGLTRTWRASLLVWQAATCLFIRYAPERRAVSLWKFWKVLARQVGLLKIIYYKLL